MLAEAVRPTRAEQFPSSYDGVVAWGIQVVAVHVRWIPACAGKAGTGAGVNDAYV